MEVRSGQAGGIGVLYSKIKFQCDTLAARSCGCSRVEARGGGGQTVLMLSHVIREVTIPTRLLQGGA